MPHPAKNGTITPMVATSAAVPPDAHQFMRFDLQPDVEQQEHHAQVRQRGERFIGGDPAQETRSDQGPGQDFTHQRGLAQLDENLSHQLGRAEHDQEYDGKGKIVSWHGKDLTNGT